MKTSHSQQKLTVTLWASMSGDTSSLLKEGNFPGRAYEYKGTSKIYVPTLSMWLLCKSVRFPILKYDQY